MTQLDANGASNIALFRAPRPIFRLLAMALVVLLSAAASSAQAPPVNAVEIGEWDEAGQDFADIWGDGQFAYLAHNGQRVVTIIDITDPTNPVFASRYDAITFASAQDVKVHDGLMFVGLESGSPGCHIVDVRDPYAPVKLTDVTVLSAVHNVFYEDGWLYLVDSSTPRIFIVDLRTYDPDSPPATISSATWTLTGVGGQFVHDITVKDGRLYAAAWDSLRIYDVSNIATEEPPLLGSIHGDNAHAVWPTDDGRFVVVADERDSGALTLYEVIEGVDAVTLEVRDYYVVPPGEARSAHNPLIDGNRLYVSYYASGVQVLEIDPETASFFPVASFDTTPSDGGDSTFAGCWGVYPFLGEDSVLASDRSLGLSVIDFSANLLKFHGTDDLPLTVPSAGGPLEIDIQAVGAAIQPATVQASVTSEGNTVNVPMVPQGGRQFLGQLPPATCGSTFEITFSAENTLSTTYVDPPDGGTHRIDVMDGAVTLFEDDFSADLGWTVTNTALTAGAWERVDPVSTGNQPEFDATGDINGFCYLTGQAAPAESAGTNDVDGGPTVLTSPTFDHSVGGGVVSYRYWLSSSSLNDDLVVEVSIDGSTWVEAQRHQGDVRSWLKGVFDIEDFVAPSATTQIRFVVADNPNDSVLEAAVDSVKVIAPVCNSQIFIDGFESGDLTAWSSSN